MMRFLSLSVSFLLLYSLSFAQVHEIVLNREGVAKKSIAKSKVGIRYTFTHDKIFSKTKTNKEGASFADIWFNNSYPNGEVGSPNLPAYKKLIRIPKGSTPSIKVVSNSEQLINLKENGIDLPIYPNQPSVSKNLDTTKVNFEINKSAYSKKSYSNAPIATLEVLGNLRSATIAQLVVNPIDYNPADGLLKVYNNIDIDVTFEGALSSDLEQEFDAKTYSPYFDATYKSLDQSSKSSYTNHPDLTKYPARMIIVCPDSFKTAIKPFIQWKISKGFTIDTLYKTTETSNQIKTFIQQKYNSATPENPAPSFLILVGDVELIPASETGTETGKKTDLYYASVDGDMFPEMYYGRLSAINKKQLTNIINKIIYYEKYQFADPTYLNKVTLIAGSDDTYNPRAAQPTIKYGTANYFNSSHGFGSINEFGVTIDPNNPNANSSYLGCYDVNRIAVGFINYTAHGSETSWQGPALSNPDILGFSNSNKYPLVVGNCCLSADFGTSECFGEAWIRAQNKGAVTYIGSSPSSYWFEDFYWAVGAFPLVGSNDDGRVPTFAESTTGAYDAPFVSNYVTTGAMVFAGNLAVTQAKNDHYYNEQSISSKYYWEAYNILGDPSLMPYFTEGETNQVNYQPTIVIGETSFTVNALANSYIAISKNNQLIGTAFVANTGVVNVPIVPITSTGNVLIVITRPQTIPIIDTITAITPTGPYLMLNSVTIDDHLANNNGKADYKESFSANLTVKNIGIEDATNVKVKIEGLDHNMFITSNDSISISNIPHSVGVNQVNINSAFSFTVLENIPDQHVVSFTLKFYSDQGSWTSVLQILLNSPILSIGKIKIDDALPGGNGDSTLNSGETCNALVQIINKGHSLAKGIKFHVSVPDSLSSIVTVNNTPTEPFSLEFGSSKTFSFGISIIPNLHQEPLVPFVLQASVVEPSELSQTFEKTIQVVSNESVNMSNNTISTDFTYFYDSGGRDADYKNSENYTLTFVAQNEYKWLKVKFTEFSTESGWDYLYIYDGPDINSQQIVGSPFSGSSLPSEIISSDKFLTFRFKSDGNTISKGWKATVESFGSTDAPILTSGHIKIFPNPVTDLLTINSEKPITRLSVYSTFGLCVLSKPVLMLNQTTLSFGGLTPGVYILIINSENSIPEKALIIKK